MSFTLTTPLALTDFGLSEYNPFIWGNNNNHDRGYEVHLPGKHATDLANAALFGSGDDRTGGNKFYLTENNLPFAVLIPQRFSYPVEKQDITGAYLKFASWAQSGGVLFPDWYTDQTGYRNRSNIY
jgi:LruC domain-containing protein